jgi:hypothetical protein
VLCLKGVPESEYISSSSLMLAAMIPTYICAMDSVTHCFFLISTAISWHALILLLSILHACQFESFCLEYFSQVSFGRMRISEAFFYSFFCSKRASATYIYRYCVCVCVCVCFLQVSPKWLSFIETWTLFWYKKFQTIFFL